MRKNRRDHMSFQKIDKEETQTPEGRECILTYGFGGKDLQVLKGYCAMIGIRDIIEVKQDMLDVKIQDILDDNVTRQETQPGPKDRAIVFNAFSGKKLNTFIGNFKSTGIKQPLLATVTQTSMGWQFRDLVEELQRERAAIAKSTQALNEDSHEDEK